MAAKRAVFLGKDGTSVPDIPFNGAVVLLILPAHPIEIMEMHLQQLKYETIIQTLNQ